MLEADQVVAVMARGDGSALESPQAAKHRRSLSHLGRPCCRHGWRTAGRMSTSGGPLDPMSGMHRALRSLDCILNCPETRHPRRGV